MDLKLTGDHHHIHFYRGPNLSIGEIPRNVRRDQVKSQHIHETNNGRRRRTRDMSAYLIFLFVRFQMQYAQASHQEDQAESDLLRCANMQPPNNGHWNTQKCQISNDMGNRISDEKLPVVYIANCFDCFVPVPI